MTWPIPWSRKRRKRWRNRRGRLAAGLVAVALAAALYAAVSSRAATPVDGAEEPALHLVAMLRGTVAGSPVAAAAVIFGTAHGRLYLVTANHVVRRGGEEATDLRLRLRLLPGEELPAELLPERDRQLDLAVLLLRDAKKLGVPLADLPFDRLGDSGALERGDPVFSAGRAGGVPWWTNLEPDRVVRRAGTHVELQSPLIRQGQSGGALFDSRRRLVGLVVADAAPNSRAVRIESVLEVLEGWGYPISLTRARSEPEVVRLPPVEPTEAGGRAVPADRRANPPATPAPVRAYPCDGVVPVRSGAKRRLYRTASENAGSVLVPEGAALRILGTSVGEGHVWLRVEVLDYGAGWMVRENVQPSAGCPP